MFQYDNLSDFQYARFHIMAVHLHFGLFWLRWFPTVQIFLFISNNFTVRKNNTCKCNGDYRLTNHLTHTKNNQLEFQTGSYKNVTGDVTYLESSMWIVLIIQNNLPPGVRAKPSGCRPLSSQWGLCGPFQNIP